MHRAGRSFKRLYLDDLIFMAISNVVIGSLMIMLPSSRTTGNVYAPAKMILVWLPVYAFFIYGVAFVALGAVTLSAYYRPVMLTYALAFGSFIWSFWTFVYVLGFLTAGRNGGLGVISILSFAQLRRHILLFPTRRGVAHERA